MLGNMPHFGSYDVYIRVDPTVLLPESINITGSVLITLSHELAHCINGQGTGCTPLDGPGIVHSSLSTTWPPPVDTIIVGLLFTATFKVEGPPGTFIHIFNDTIIDSATGQPLPHTTTPGIYGNPGKFEFSPTPTLWVPITGSNQTVVSVISLNGFSGTVNLTAAIPSLASYFLNVTIAPKQVRIGPSSLGVFTLNVTSAEGKGATPGTFEVDIAGTSGLVSNTTSISILIPEVYLLSEFFYPQQGVQGQAVSIQSTFQNKGVLPIRIAGVTLTSDFGTFALFNSQRQGPTICGQSYTGTVDVTNGQASRTLTFTIPRAANPGNHTFTVTIIWQYLGTVVLYNNPLSLWCDTQPLVLKRSMIVMESPSSNPTPNPTPNPTGAAGSVKNTLSALFSMVARNWPFALAAYLGVTVLATALALRTRRRNKQPREIKDLL